MEQVTKMKECLILIMDPVVSSALTNTAKLSFRAPLSIVSTNYVPTASDLHLLSRMVPEQTRLPVHRVIKSAMLSKW
jgi:hypothetical protein